MLTGKVNPDAFGPDLTMLDVTTGITDSGMVELRFNIEGLSLHFAALVLEPAMARHLADRLNRSADDAEKIDR